MARQGVFKIINKQTGKVYVGSSNTNIDRLLDSYWNKLYSGTHHNRALQSDFDYYGSSNFEYVIVNDNCYSENEVRSVREREIYLNRHNTYNEDVPVHYNGGNTNAAFESHPKNANNYIENLLDIVDKSNLKESDKNTLKLEIVNRKINYEYHLNQKISFYEQLPGLLDIVDKSNLRESDKNEIKLDIKKGNITNKSQLYGALGFHNQIKDLIDFVESSNLKQEYEDKLIKYIKIGYIKDKDHLNKEICAYKNLSQFDKYTIKKLADEYCRITSYESWVKQRDKIIFENAETETKSIRVDSLQKEIDSLKANVKLNNYYKGSNIYSSFLNSIEYDSHSNKSVKEIAEYICDTLGFDSFEENSSNCILFDNEYNLCGVKLGEMYELFNNSINFKLGDEDSTIGRKLEKTVKTDNFNKKFKDLIFDYIDKRNIQFWDILPNGNILLFDKYLHIVTEQQIIKDLDSDYAKLNRKFGSSLLGSVFRLFSNKPAETNPKDELLTILSRSATPIKAKLEIKNQISYGKIKTKDELKTVIKNSRPKEKAKRRWSKHFKRCRNCGRLVKKDYKVCGSCNYDFKRRKVMPKTDIESDNHYNDGSKAPSGKKICPDCGRIINDYAIRCVSCNHHFKDADDAKYGKINANIKIESNNQHTSSNVPKDNKICPNCGKEIKQNAIRCKHCNYYFKQGKVLPKTNIKKSKNVSSKNDLKTCPNCGKEINNRAVRCKHCNYYFKQGKVIPKQTFIKKPNDNMQAKRNVKFCSDCHGEINIAATKCIHCGSKSFVYNKNITQLKSFIIKYDMRAEYQWKYIQITYDDEEYIILAKSKAELKRKVVENHLPWDDKKIDTKIPAREGKYYPKQSKSRRGYSGTYYGHDYEYDETPSHQYYEKDNFTSQEVLGDDDYYINW